MFICKKMRLFNFSVKKFGLIKVLGFLFLVALGVGGCTQRDVVESPLTTEEIILTPYLTKTPLPEKNQGDSQTPTVIPTKLPSPTPTPFIYTVVENDTLIGIAFQYSVALEELIAANPGLDPNFLTIGMTLTIPLEGVVASTLPTPTPIALILQTPDCYKLADQKVQCLVMVENNQSFAVENLMVQLTLRTQNGAWVDSQTMASPLNIIPTAGTIVLSAIFDSVPEQELDVFAELLTVIPVEMDSPRYLKADLNIQEAVLGSGSQNVNLRGSVELLPEQADAALVWVVAFAYDDKDRIIGYRKWVAEERLLAGEQLNFEMTVYSLGPPVSRWELLIEARP